MIMLPRELAQNMLTEAAVREHPRIFEASGHASHNLGIPYQQYRCRSLVWALIRRRYVQHGSVIAVVGGGFSGMMLSVCLALQRRCIVHLFEQESELLERFRHSYFRFLHPNLNSRDLPVRYSPNMSAQIDEPEVFNWRDGTACEVAHFWLREFQTYADQLPIFVHTNHEVTNFVPSNDESQIRLTINGNGDVDMERVFDLAILATGFGLESDVYETSDFSYWQSGEPLAYRQFRGQPQKKVLVSGCGDSGLIELLHHTFEGFDHKWTATLYPEGTGLESYLQPALEQSIHWEIWFNQEVSTYDYRVISELCWFVQQKQLRSTGHSLMSAKSGIDVLLRSKLNDLFNRIESWLVNQGTNSINPALNMSADQILDEVYTNANMNEQIVLKEELAPLINDIASLEIKGIIDKVDLADSYDFDALRSMMSGQPQLYLNGLTPTPYTASLSPVNIIYMKLCNELKAFKYRQGLILSISQEENGYRVLFSDKSEEHFDHVATRYGAASKPALASLATPKQKRAFYDCWLLEVPTSRKPDPQGRPEIIHIIVLPKEGIKQARTRFLKVGRSSFSRATVVNKLAYRFNFECEIEPIKSQIDFISWQADLINALKMNKSIRYDLQSFADQKQ